MAFTKLFGNEKSKNCAECPCYYKGKCKGGTPLEIFKGKCKDVDVEDPSKENQHGAI